MSFAARATDRNFVKRGTTNIYQCQKAIFSSEELKKKQQQWVLQKRAEHLKKQTRRTPQNASVEILDCANLHFSALFQISRPPICDLSDNEQSDEDEFEEDEEGEDDGAQSDYGPNAEFTDSAESGDDDDNFNPKSASKLAAALSPPPLIGKSGAAFTHLTKLVNARRVYSCVCCCRARCC